MSNCLLHTTRCPFTHNTCYTAEAPQKPHARAADSPDTVPTDTHTHQRARELKSSDSHNVLASRWSFPCPAPLPHIKYLRYLTCPRRYLPAPYRAPRFAIPVLPSLGREGALSTRHTSYAVRAGAGRPYIVPGR
eukprot:scaffold127184_cov84-Phaeocystis_antarctica.AAC.2